VGDRTGTDARELWRVAECSEENSEIPGVGIDELEKRGELAFLKNGPLIWLDSADIGPTLGTGSVASWQLKANGKLFHSGLPHKAINAIELASEAVRVMQQRFHADHPMTATDQRYLYNVGTHVATCLCVLTWTILYSGLLVRNTKPESTHRLVRRCVCGSAHCIRMQSHAVSSQARP
jgi:hypothetical protein